jgi:hypothetical protein
MPVNARRATLVALMWSVLGAAVAGQPGAAPGPTVPRRDEATIAAAAARVRAHVTFLADDLLEGREAGTRGHEIAARYMAAQFALAGATPGARDGKWFHTVTLHEARQTGQGEAVLRLPGGDRPLRDGVDALIGGAMLGGTAAVDAPLVFIGYGIVDPQLGVDDLAGLDVKGKIVVRLAGVPQGLDSEVAAHLQSDAGIAAAQRGALGALGISTRAHQRVVSFDRILEMSRNDSAETTYVTTKGEPYTTVGGNRAGALLSPEIAALLFQGTGPTLEQILEEADRPGGRPKGFNLPVSARLSVSSETRRYDTPAVLGLIAGSDPVLRDEYVVLTAHLDHVGIAKTSGEGDRIHNGALDNAMGSAMLLEVARALTSEGRRPRRSVLLVAHTAEEKGLLGAMALADDLPVPKDKVVASINLDMPVLLHDFTDVVAFGGTHSSLEGAVARAAAAEGVTLSPDPMPDEAIFVRSDHYALVRAGVPSIMLSPGMANGGDKGFELFLTTHYHKVTDDVSLPIRWDAAARFAKLNESILRLLADDDARVRWYEGDYFGVAFAPDAPKVPRPRPSAP